MSKMFGGGYPMCLGRGQTVGGTLLIRPYQNAPHFSAECRAGTCAAVCILRVFFHHPGPSRFTYNKLRIRPNVSSESAGSCTS
ncbi:MAG TPA: hypothetical protein VGL38_11680 [bacterium]